MAQAALPPGIRSTVRRWLRHRLLEVLVILILLVLLMASVVILFMVVLLM